MWGDYIDELVGHELHTGVMAGRYYAHSNHLYSVEALTGSAGSPVERYAYSAYGERRVFDGAGTLRTASIYAQRSGFTGKEHDHETELVFFESRYYSEQMGRFISRDKEGYIDGMSLYSAYFIPLNLDPTGRFAIGWHAEITIELANSAGFSRDGAHWMAFCNIHVDLSTNFGDNPLQTKENKEKSKENSEWHFDNLKNISEVNSKMKWFMDQMNSAADKKLCGECDPKPMICFLGKLLHANQDFYAHSNWSEITESAGYTSENAPTYGEWRNDGNKGASGEHRKRIGNNPSVRTGNYPDVSDDPNSHANMNHDCDSRPNFARAVALAKRSGASLIAQVKEMWRKKYGDECLKKILAYTDGGSSESAIGGVKLISSAAFRWKGCGFCAH